MFRRPTSAISELAARRAWSGRPGHAVRLAIWPHPFGHVRQRDVSVCRAQTQTQTILQDWISDVLSIPDDAELITDRAVGSTVRMFFFATNADVVVLLTGWEDISGPGIGNAKIIVAPTTDDGRSIIEFDPTLN